MTYLEMKQHAIASYLQLVVGCDHVIYDAEWFGGKDMSIDLIGVKGLELAVVVDIAEKFQGYPKNMRPDTLRRKLIQRFALAQERLKGGGIKKVQAEVLFFGAPMEQLEIVLPSVVQALWREHQIQLKIVPTAEVQERIAKTAEAVLRHKRDIGNPFAQAILLASGVLETPPLDVEPLLTQFPLELPDPYAIPNFVEAFLDSKYVLDWLGFDDTYGTLDTLRELMRQRRSSAWQELAPWLKPWGWEDEEQEIEISPKYTVEQIVGVMNWLVHNAARVLDAWHEQQGYEREKMPVVMEVGFMLPFLSKNRYFPPEFIETEIVRYGGDRDLVRMHFQNPNPDKSFYRGYLRLVLQGPYDSELPPPKLPSMEVPLRSSLLPRGVTASLSLLYPKEFAGYFFLTFDAIAHAIRPFVERPQEIE